MLYRPSKMTNTGPFDIANLILEQLFQQQKLRTHTPKTHIHSYIKMFYSLLGHLTARSQRVLIYDAQSSTWGGVSPFWHFGASSVYWTFKVCNGVRLSIENFMLNSIENAYLHRSVFLSFLGLDPYCANSSMFSRKGVHNFPRFPFSSGYDIALFQWYLFLGPLLANIETKCGFEVAAGT